MRRADGRSNLIGTLGFIAGVFGYVFLAMNLGKGFAIPVGIVGAIASVIALGPFGRAIAKRIEGAPADPEALPEPVAVELEELRGRLGELEERVDFSERLLAQQPREVGRG